MEASKQAEIRNYLKSGAGGTFVGVDSFDVIARALRHSKIVGVTAEQFGIALKAYGITPDVVRAGHYRLVLPLANR